MSIEESAGKATSIKTTFLRKRLFNLLPGIVLALAYFLTSISRGGGTYNLIIAGALIAISLCIRLISETMLKKTVRCMFLTGVVMGVAGISSPIYFAVFQGVVSLMDLTFSIICIILTVTTIVRIKDFNIL